MGGLPESTRATTRELVERRELLWRDLVSVLAAAASSAAVALGEKEDVGSALIKSISSLIGSQAAKQEQSTQAIGAVPGAGAVDTAASNMGDTPVSHGRVTALLRLLWVIIATRRKARWAESNEGRLLASQAPGGGSASSASTGALLVWEELRSPSVGTASTLDRSTMRCIDAIVRAIGAHTISVMACGSCKAGEAAEGVPEELQDVWEATMRLLLRIAAGGE